MTYRFLIVDDEYYIRQRIRLCIPWQDYGFECAGEAANVAQAEEILTHTHMDLILLDISMPGESGLELASRLRQKGEGVKIIILTGFSTFEYARQAITHGVSGYLLKPIQTRELIETLEKIKMELDEQHELQTKRSEWTNVRLMADDALRSLFFQSIFTRQSTADDNMLLEYGIHEDTPYMMFVTNSPSRFVNSLSYEQRQSVRQALGNCILVWLSQQQVPVVLQLLDGDQHLVFLVPQGAVRQDPEDFLTMLTDAVSGAMTPSLELLTGYGIAPFGNCTSLATAYRTAIDYLVFKTVYGVHTRNPGVIIPPRHQLEQMQLLHESIRGHLFQNYAEGIRTVLKELFSSLGKNPISISALETELSALVSIAMNYSATFGITMEEQERGRYTGAGILHSGYSLLEIQEKFENLFLSVSQSQNEEALPMIHKIVIQATELIQKEFRNSGLGLETIASALLISPAYLSRNFKRIEGLSVMQYITKYRMEYAMTQLKETQLPISRISEMAGYQDSFYFSKRFKQFYGLSPSQVSGKQ